MSSFDGVAEIYRKSRHGYPIELREQLIETGTLTTNSTVIDLGAGTGQLSLLVADTATSVVAIDPEPGMIATGQEATKAHPNVRWQLGAGRDISRLVEPPIDLVLIGNAFHHMDQPQLLVDLGALVSDTGAVVVCSSSVPVWLQDTDWSRALRQQLSQELGRSVGNGGTPDHDADVQTLVRSPFADVTTWRRGRDHRRWPDSIIGEIVSSASGALSQDAISRLLSTLVPYLTDGAVSERVTTTALIARRSA